MSLDLHQDSAWFQEAIRHTAAVTGFLPRLIEKDYFCSVLLEALSTGSHTLVFKGGTCLSKIHAGFFRLSEDLDFSLSMPVDSTRGERSRIAAPLRAQLEEALMRAPALSIDQPLTGSNNCTQYGALIAYTSVLTGQTEALKFEVGLREPVCQPPLEGMALTLVRNPLTDRPALPAIPVRSLTYEEAMAEKIRAALCRREPAIRDFFDVGFALRDGRLDLAEPGFRDLVLRKIQVAGTETPDLSPARIEQLRRQVETHLRPVLREPDAQAFSLDTTLAAVRDFALSLGLVTV